MAAPALRMALGSRVSPELGVPLQSTGTPSVGLRCDFESHFIFVLGSQRGLLPSLLITRYRKRRPWTQNGVLQGRVDKEEPPAQTLSSKVEPALKADSRCRGQAYSGRRTCNLTHIPRF